METRVTFLEDPALVLTMAGEFLASQPARHNIILSLLHTRVAYPEPGRYWVASQGSRVAGVVFQSPLTIAATLTPMEPNVTAAMVEAIADAGVVLPGVNGEAATAASFAGQWTERFKSAAIPFQGVRLYEVTEAREIAPITGALRRAVPDDRGLTVRWARAFQEEADENISDAEVLVDRWLPSGQLWLWDDGGAMSMAVSREPAVAGVIRISGVYTPPENRRRGYAGACVHGLSKRIRETGYRCILYTDLGNPSSNSIYRRIGYRAVAEGVRYRFAE
jgi:uncharacterized protein